MNKREREALEAALTEAALRRTSPVDPDVVPPMSGAGGLTTGFILVGEYSDSPRVDVACSSSVHHGVGQVNQTSTQGSRKLYSTKIAALRALRYKVETRCAALLRRVDKMIEEEAAKEAQC